VTLWDAIKELLSGINDWPICEGVEVFDHDNTYLSTTTSLWDSLKALGILWLIGSHNNLFLYLPSYTFINPVKQLMPLLRSGESKRDVYRDNITTSRL